MDGLFQKKSKRGLRMWNFQGYQRNSMRKFERLIKNKVKFQGWPRKINVEFLWVFVFGLGISKGSNTILWNIQGLSFVLSGISRGKVKIWKIPGEFSQKYILNPPVWIFSGIAHSKFVYITGQKTNKISKEFWKTGYLTS